MQKLETIVEQYEWKVKEGRGRVEEEVKGKEGLNKKKRDSKETKIRKGKIFEDMEGKGRNGKAN